MKIGKRYEMWKEKDLPEFLQLLLTDKFGTCIVGILGFAISIAAQITFPAPRRSYFATTIFAVKQMILVFMPSWCVGALGIFAFLAIKALEIDRLSQVSTVKVKFT
ncbi:unnamed protein product [Adineta steineri]|uniref:Uncharacterized protein n=1 Tax=Adineta steineri TaxID=433720 RepID=A0A813QFV3_9BILA|nr:unnamed protein product [Adineta steineri]